MQITINTESLSSTDIAVLKLLTGEVGLVNVDAPAAGSKPPAKKTAAAKPAAKAEPEPEPEEDLVGDDTPTLKDAVKLATQLVSEGKSGDIKVALEEVGALKVSKLEGDQIAAFIAHLS